MATETAEKKVLTLEELGKKTPEEQKKSLEAEGDDVLKKLRDDAITSEHYEVAAIIRDTLKERGTTDKDKIEEEKKNADFEAEVKKRLIEEKAKEAKTQSDEEARLKQLLNDDIDVDGKTKLMDEGNLNINVAVTPKAVYRRMKLKRMAKTLNDIKDPKAGVLYIMTMTRNRYGGAALADIKKGRWNVFGGAKRLKDPEKFKQKFNNKVDKYLERFKDIKNERDKTLVEGIRKKFDAIGKLYVQQEVAKWQGFDLNKSKK